MSNLSQFQDMVNSQTEEFVRENGYVNCEFSTSDDNFEIKEQILNKYSEKLKALDSEWRIFKCETCRGHNKSKPIHVVIAKKNDSEAIKAHTEMV